MRLHLCGIKATLAASVERSIRCAPGAFLCACASVFPRGRRCRTLEASSGNRLAGLPDTDLFPFTLVTWKCRGTDCHGSERNCLHESGLCQRGAELFPADAFVCASIGCADEILALSFCIGRGSYAAGNDLAAVYVAACIAALYTHQVALIFIVCANAAMLAMYASSPREAVSKALQLIVVNIVVVIAWLPLVFRMASVSSGIGWLEQAGPVEVVREIIAMIMPNKVGFLLMGIYTAALLVAAVILVQGRRRELILASHSLVSCPA